MQKSNILFHNKPHSATENKSRPQGKSSFPTCLFQGVDEKTIIDILVKRSNEQRQQIKEAYQQSSGKVRWMTMDTSKGSVSSNCASTHCSLWNRRWRTPWREIWRMWCWRCWRLRPSMMPSSSNWPWRYTQMHTQCCYIEYDQTYSIHTGVETIWGQDYSSAANTSAAKILIWWCDNFFFVQFLTHSRYVLILIAV